MKTILVSAITSLLACLCFTFPVLLIPVFYFLIGVYVIFLGKRVDNHLYSEDFVFFSLFLWPITIFVILESSGFSQVIEELIPGYTVTIEIEKNEN